MWRYKSYLLVHFGGLLLCCICLVKPYLRIARIKVKQKQIAMIAFKPNARKQGHSFWWLSVQVQQKPHFSASAKHFWCVDMSARIFLDLWIITIEIVDEILMYDPAAHMISCIWMAKIFVTFANKQTMHSNPLFYSRERGSRAGKFKCMPEIVAEPRWNKTQIDPRK